MKNAIVLISIFISFNLFSQPDSLYFDEIDSTYFEENDSTGHDKLPFFPFELFCGKKLFNSDFYGQLNTFGNVNLGTPLTFFGLGINSVFISTREYQWPGHIALLFVLPQNILINADKKAKITGYMFSMTAYGWNFLKDTKRSMLTFSVGLNVGNLSLIGDNFRQKNPFISPMISFCPKFYVNRISIALNIQFDYDVTNPNWKKSWFEKSDKPHIDKFRQTGISTFICIGYESK